MSFVISLCHFCDQHGPSILQTCYLSSQEEELTNSNEPSCQACCMADTYVSIDRMTGYRYMSCRLPAQRTSLVSWLNHVCVRSLSCEVNPCVFSEPPNSALSLSFSVRDAQARGFYHWFSIVVSARDLGLLASCWPFLSRQVQHVVTWLQDKASQAISPPFLVVVVIRDYVQCVKNTGKVYNVEKPFRDRAASQSRPLTQLVKYKAVHARLHCWFSWMIYACNSRLTESIPRSPYYRLQPQHVFEVGSLKSLRVFLGETVFDLAALCLMEGRQVIVRGDIPELVKATVTTLQELLPGDWCRTLPDCDEYLEPGQCGLLGVSTQVAVPCPCRDIVRVDMVQGTVSAKTTAVMPLKYPTLLGRMVKALSSELLRGKALTHHLQAYRQEWTHIAKLVHLTRMENTTSLLVALGVKPQDQQLVAYWSKNLCKS